MPLMAEKKKGSSRKQPSRSGSSLHVYINPTIRAALDRFVESQRLRPSITDVVELALTQFLEREGCWPHDPTDSESDD